MVFYGISMTFSNKISYLTVFIKSTDHLPTDEPTSDQLTIDSSIYWLSVHRPNNNSLLSISGTPDKWNFRLMEPISPIPWICINKPLLF